MSRARTKRPGKPSAAWSTPDTLRHLGQVSELARKPPPGTLSGLCTPQSCQLCWADVAAAADDRHLPADEPLGNGQNRRQRGRAGRLDEVARLLDHQPGRGLQRIL